MSTFRSRFFWSIITLVAATLASGCSGTSHVAAGRSADASAVDAPSGSPDAAGNPVPDSGAADSSIDGAPADGSADAATPPPTDAGTPPPDAGTPPTPPTPPPGPPPTSQRFYVGMCGPTSEVPGLDAFLVASKTPASTPKLCHIYTYWNIANSDTDAGSQTHKSLTGLIDWFGKAKGECDRVLVTFKGAGTVSTSPPSVATFEQSFLDFVALTAPGKPLAYWAGRLSYTPWNEPNNKALSGNGLDQTLYAKRAAGYYLAIRRHCLPSAGCLVAAGDFATNGGMAKDIAKNCQNDLDPANTTTKCANPSIWNTNNSAPSYLDLYKNYLVTLAPNYGLPANFRPEVMAYHPWHDVNSYIGGNQICSTYANCATIRLLKSLASTWSNVEIWDDEIGVGQQASPPGPDPNSTQPCGAAFLVRLTELSPRITRVYYMHFLSGNGPLFDPPLAIRPAGTVLAQRATSFNPTSGSCPAMGLPVN